MVWETLKDIGVILGIPLGRAVIGWAENAFADGSVSKIEWKLLVSTILRIGTIGLASYFGLQNIGFNVDLWGTMMGTVVLDFFLMKFKK